jgi:serine/threonine protein kinase
MTRVTKIAKSTVTISKHPEYKITNLELSDGAHKAVYKVTKESGHELFSVKAYGINNLPTKIELRFSPSIDPFDLADVSSSIPLAVISPYYANRSLEHYFQREASRSIPWRERLDPTATTKLIFGIAAGMYGLHVDGNIHGSLKPSNILLTNELEPKICDFIYAKYLRQPAKTEPSFFTAPEVASRGEYGQPSDVYSFGVLLYWLFAGEDLDSQKRIDSAAIPARPDMPFKYHPSIPDFYWEQIMACWHFDPAKRPDFGKIMLDLDGSRAYLLKRANPEEVKRYEERFKGLYPRSISRCASGPFVWEPLQAIPTPLRTHPIPLETGPITPK